MLPNESNRRLVKNHWLTVLEFMRLTFLYLHRELPLLRGKTVYGLKWNYLQNPALRNKNLTSRHGFQMDRGPASQRDLLVRKNRMTTRLTQTLLVQTHGP